MVARRIKTGHTDVIRSGDLNMVTIRSFVANAWGPAVGSDGQATRSRFVEGSIGSVSSVGSLNYVRLRQTQIDSYRGDAGTVRIGTNIGTARISFIAFGN